MQYRRNSLPVFQLKVFHRNHYFLSRKGDFFILLCDFVRNSPLLFIIVIVITTVLFCLPNVFSSEVTDSNVGCMINVISLHLKRLKYVKSLLK